MFIDFLRSIRHAYRLITGNQPYRNQRRKPIVDSPSTPTASQERRTRMITVRDSENETHITCGHMDTVEAIADEVMKVYHRNDICMRELLATVYVTGKSVEETVALYHLLLIRAGESN